MLHSAFLLTILSLSTAIASAQQPSVAVKEAFAPVYPAIAVAARVEGTVIVRVEIRPDGTVLKAEVISGPEMLRISAIQAAKKWIFTTDPAANRLSIIRLIYGLLSKEDLDETQTVFLPPDAIRIKHPPMKTTTNYAY
jgi:TonB family protein